MADFMYVDGFIVYRVIDFINEQRILDCRREVLMECQTEEVAKEVVEKETPKWPNDNVYYEPGTITI